MSISFCTGLQDARLESHAHMRRDRNDRIANVAHKPGVQTALDCRGIAKKRRGGGRGGGGGGHGCSVCLPGSTVCSAVSGADKQAEHFSKLSSHP